MPAIMSPNVTAQPCYEITAVTGWDALLWAVLPSRWFARRVARKLRASLGGVRSFMLPDGSIWLIDPVKLLR